MRYGCAFLLAVWLISCAAEPQKFVSVGGGPDRDDAGRDDGDAGRDRTYQPVPGGGGVVGTSGGRATENSGKPCDSDSDCGESNVCFQGTCVGDGMLRFSLSWTADTDFDLHVLTPDGVEIYYGNPSYGGGLLDVDDCVGELCRDPGDTHVENIFFDGTLANGTYTYWVHNYAGAITARFELEISENGRVAESEEGSLPLAEPRESSRYTYSY